MFIYNILVSFEEPLVVEDDQVINAPIADISEGD